MLKPEPFVKSDRHGVSREDFKLNTLDAALLGRSDCLFGESAAVTRAAISWKNAHAQAANVSEPFELGSDDVAPSDHFVRVGNGNNLDAAAGEEATYKRRALLDWRPDKKAQVPPLARDRVDSGVEAGDM